jgi:ubiquinone/menaquinone biosynthesis C-methylase UbiE
LIRALVLKINLKEDDMSKKGYKGIGMEGAIARSYDRNSRKTRMEEIRAWANDISKIIKDNSSVLEVAPGPGYLSIELAKTGKYNVTALEISRTFVEIAKKNASRADVNLDIRQGNVSLMPFNDNSFDFIFCSAAFKNFDEPVTALQEMARVLKKGGKALIVDMRHDVPDREIAAYVRNDMHEKGFGAFLMKIAFKYFLRKRAYTREQFEFFISKSGFNKSDIKEAPLGFRILLEK